MAIKRRGCISQDGLWRIWAKLCFNGEPSECGVHFIIDSGSEISILSPDIAKGAGIVFDDLPSEGELNIGNSGDCKARRLNDVDIILDHDGNSEDFITICKMYLPDNGWKRNDFSLIGQDVLRQFDIESDNKTKSIVLTYVGCLTTTTYVPRR